MLTKRRQDTKDAKELMELCKQTDSDKSDSITLDEFQTFMLDDRLKAYFDICGIDITNTGIIFQNVGGRLYHPIIYAHHISKLYTTCIHTATTIERQTSG